mmetsp:Transcript_27585/g.69633  ORF Transcript_27585/g.69633 Transcript_27585/m.69633 type:complete len:250 (+) Transcript_27585:58-807(+)
MASFRAATLMRNLSSRMLSTSSRVRSHPASFRGFKPSAWMFAPTAGASALGFALAAGEAECEGAENKRVGSDQRDHARASIVDDIHVEHEWDPARYGAYAFLIARIGKSARFLAYSSDVGEAFRPVVPTSVVNASYGLAIGYCTYDVGYAGYKESKAGGDVARAVTKQTLFQGLASIGLPFLIIHTSVHAAQKGFKRFMPGALKWGPTIVGLVLIPFLPAVCDEPVEHAIDWGFDEYWPSKDGKKEHAH